ncbi:Uncharacterized protein SCF082_LOCUS17697 [Durusdinium trenchii]|uniref:Uncharacterized protein n=1 Tax=Durusdinium trenchii TaxID=1381693 RepID=A0ABP0KJ51_9DINO
MDRALAPLAVGATLGTWAWWRESVIPAIDGSLGRLVAHVGFDLLASSPTKTGPQILEGFLHISAVFLLLHFWTEILEVCRLLLRCIVLIGRGFSLLLEVGSECLQLWALWAGRCIERALHLAEQEAVFTSEGMALAAGPPIPVGSVILVSRPPEWDEVMIGAFTDNYNHAVCKTTNSIGDAWIWVLVRVDGLHLRLPTNGAHGERRAPAGIPDGDINWVCTPPAGANQWRPGVAEIPNICAEAGLILAQYIATGSTWPANIPGVSGPLVEITGVGAGPPGPAAAAAGALGPAAPAAAGLAVGGDSPSGVQSADLHALEAAVRDLQRLAVSPGGRSNDKSVSYTDLTHVDALKLKRKGDLLAFASKHPGALTAHFLAGVYSRLSKGSLTRTGQLRDVSVTSWAHQFSGLTEIRDLKEVVTLAEVLDSINRKEIARALDIICQRIIAIQSAKQKGGSWEKAEAVELIDTRKSLASSGALGELAKAGLSGGGNLILLALNWLHGGRCELLTSLVTAAHRRIFTRVGKALEALVMTDEPVMGPEGLDHYMRQTQLYTGSGVVLALGVKGGVPDKAADVPLGQRLQALFPVMAEQVSSPSHLLLPPARRPRRVKRGFTWVAPSYPELVKKNVKGLTDVVANDAHLPEDRRLHPDLIIPGELPIWGSIIDDIWGLDHLEDENAAGVGPEWLNRAEDVWCLRGVEPNSKKTVNQALGEEVQGYYIHPSAHWVGLSMEKRRYLFQATFMALMRPKVVVGVADRLIGKHSFLRAGRRRELVSWPDEVWIELCISTLLIPFAHFDMSSDWSKRVECTDASMTGLGRAYGIAPTAVVQAMARFSDHSKVYTNLTLPWSIGLTEEHKCHMRKIRLPKERIRWRYIGTPWTCQHITLGEADAIAWAAEDRLRRPGDDGGFGSPPCSTISAARHVAMQGRQTRGPRPLRARQNPWVALPYCTSKESMSVDIGTALFLITLGLLGEICLRGGWIGLEHPADRKREPYPSFFATPEVSQFMHFFRLFYTELDQCMYGAISKKPTGLLQQRGCPSLSMHCTHSVPHAQLLGLDSRGHFRTTPAAQYPSGLCFALASSFVERLVPAHVNHYLKPFAPRVSKEFFPDPWGMSCNGSYRWVEPCPAFLAGVLERIHSAEIHPRTGSPQQ